jgi:hypothetical protein
MNKTDRPDPDETVPKAKLSHSQELLRMIEEYANEDKLVTDDLRSYGAAARELGLSRRHERGRNNRAENSHQPTRDGSAICRGSRVRDQPTISVRPRRHLQHLQRPASPHLSEDTPVIPSLGHADVARGDCCGVIAIECWICRTYHPLT